MGRGGRGRGKGGGEEQQALGVLQNLAAALALDPMTAHVGGPLLSKTDEVTKALDIATGAARRTQYMGDQARLYSSTHAWARPKPPTMLAHETCRAMVKYSPLIATIHRRRQEAVRPAFREWKGNRTHIGWRVVHTEHDNPRVNVDRVDGIRERIAQAEHILRCPHGQFADHLETVGIPLIADHLTIDRPVINVHYGPTGRVPVGFSHVDGATIMPVAQYLDRWLASRTDRTGQIGSDYMPWTDIAELAYHELKLDVDRIRWVQIQRYGAQMPDAFLTEEDLIVAPANPSPDINEFGYGIPPVEANWVAATLYTFGVGWLGSYFGDALADTIIAVTGPGAATATAEMSNILRTQHSGVDKHKYPFVTLPPNGKIEPISLRTSNAQDMQFSEALHHLASMVAAGYQEEASLVGLDTRGPGRNAMNEGSRAAQMEAQQHAGERSTMMFLAERMLTPLVRRIDPDLKVIVQGLDEDKESDVVELRTKKVGSYIGVNDARGEDDLPPIQLDDFRLPGSKLTCFDLPGQYGISAFNQLLQSALQKQQAQEQQQAQQPGPPQGMPGAMQWQGGQEQSQQGAPPQGGPQQPAQGQQPSPQQAARPRAEDMRQGEAGKSADIVDEMRQILSGPETDAGLHRVVEILSTIARGGKEGAKSAPQEEATPAQSGMASFLKSYGVT